MDPTANNQTIALSRHKKSRSQDNLHIFSFFLLDYHFHIPAVRLDIFSFPID